MADTIALTREQLVYVVPEVTVGTLVAPTPALPAIGTITLTGIPSADQTITIGSETWTFKAARGAAYQITIGADAPATVTNIVAAITLDSTVVTAVDGTGDTVVVTTVDAGVDMNDLAFTETASNLTMDGSGKLGGTQAGTYGYMIPAAGVCELNQVPDFTDSPEIIDSLDILERFQNMSGPAKWSLPILARPEGTAGRVPVAAILFKCLLGDQDISAGVNVTHTQSSDKPSFSLWTKKSHTLFFCRGCSVSEAKVAVKNTGAVEFDFSGEGFQMGWVGTNSLSAGESAAQTELSVHDARYFCIGGLFQNSTTSNDGTNGGLGFQITDVDYTNNTITIAAPGVPTGGWAENDVIEPFLPRGVTWGHPMESRYTTVTRDSIASTIKTFDLTIGCPAKFFTDEITTSGYPDSYVPDARNITGKLGLRFRTSEATRFYSGLLGVNEAWVITFGNVAGQKLQISMPKSNTGMPNITSNPPVIDLDCDLKALATAGDDSLSLTWF